jgi:hypothetical protein
VLPKFTQDFSTDFAQLLRADEPFALVRFHDGEYRLCEGLLYDARSGWHVDGPTWIQFPLREALACNVEGYYVGISPPCDVSEAANYYRSRVKVPSDRLTFATIFMHANYKSLPLFLRKYKDPVLVACKNGDIKVPANGMREAWDLDAVVEELMKVEGRPIFVSAGPCADVIIHRYWTRQPAEKRVTIIDTGSALDLDIHGKPTRDFHSDKAAQRHKCDWNEWHPFQALTPKRLQREAKKSARRRLNRQLAEQGFKSNLGRHTTAKPKKPHIRVHGTERQEQVHRNVRVRKPKK